jgi:hypothetical protein
VRIFGDALQAILTFDPTIPGWDALMSGVPTVALTGAWRWSEVPELGQWIARARAHLRLRQPIPLNDIPASVRVLEVDRPARTAWTECAAVREVIEEHGHDNKLVVLGRRNDEVSAIARVPSLHLVVNEGSDLDAAEQLIEDAIAGSEDPRAVAEALVSFMVATGTLANTSAEIISALGPACEDSQFEELLMLLRARPTLSGVITAVRGARRSARAIGWEILRPVAVQAIATLPEQCNSDDVSELAYRARRSASELAVPPRCASTIHKAKGREFDHVIIPSLDSNTFRDTQDDRHLLYVALSRAMKRLTLIVPLAAPSPLVLL